MSDAPFELVDAKDGFIDSDWFHHCRETGTPFVVVRSGERSADVLWDYVTMPPECDAAIRRDLPGLERAALAIFERHAIPESHLRVRATLIGFDRLPFDRAKAAAAELYRLMAGYLPASGTTSEGFGDEIESSESADASDRARPLRLWTEVLGASSAA